MATVIKEAVVVQQFNMPLGWTCFSAHQWWIRLADGRPAGRMCQTIRPNGPRRFGLKTEKKEVCKLFIMHILPTERLSLEYCLFLISYMYSNRCIQVIQDERAFTLLILNKLRRHFCAGEATSRKCWLRSEWVILLAGITQCIHPHKILHQSSHRNKGGTRTSH